MTDPEVGMARWPSREERRRWRYSRGGTWQGRNRSFSPATGEAGNSVKAQKVIAYVANKLDINLYSPGSVGLK